MVRSIRKFLTLGVIGIFIVMPISAQAQDQSLEDIRLDIATLGELLAELRAELLATGNSGLTQGSTGDVLQRLNTLEAELGMAMGRVETLQFRINQIVDDGTNRIGDIEFRLTELEGGDTTSLGNTVPIGGDTQAGDTTSNQQFASDEERSFNEAVAEYDAGNYQAASEMFSRFVETYTVGPLTGEAQFRKGQSLAGLQDWGGAARGYLDSFSGAPNGPFAADSLFGLAVSLGELGQIEQACLTFDEIRIRYPDKAALMGNDIMAQKQRLSCP